MPQPVVLIINPAADGFRGSPGAARLAGARAAARAAARGVGVDVHVSERPGHASESVPCTAAPDDTFVATRLAGPLRGAPD